MWKGRAVVTGSVSTCFELPRGSEATDGNLCRTGALHFQLWLTTNNSKERTLEKVEDYGGGRECVMHIQPTRTCTDRIEARKPNAG